MKYPWKEEFVMPCFTVALDLPLESVLSDALFKLAGELSLEAISRKAARREKKAPDFG